MSHVPTRAVNAEIKRRLRVHDDDASTDVGSSSDAESFSSNASGGYFGMRRPPALLDLKSERNDCVHQTKAAKAFAKQRRFGVGQCGFRKTLETIPGTPVAAFQCEHDTDYQRQAWFDTTASADDDTRQEITTANDADEKMRFSRAPSFMSNEQPGSKSSGVSIPHRPPGVWLLPGKTISNDVDIECRHQVEEDVSNCDDTRRSMMSMQPLLYGRVCVSQSADSRNDAQSQDAERKRNPLWVRWSVFADPSHEAIKAALFGRGGSSAMPIKKRPIFPQDADADVIALRAFQQDLPVKRIVRESYFLTHPQRAMVSAPPPGLVPLPR